MYNDENLVETVVSYKALLPTMILGYRVAGQLPIGPSLPFNLYEVSAQRADSGLRPVSIGLILGDAHVFRNKTENASLHIEQSIKKEEYLLHLYELFKDYCKSAPVSRNRIDKNIGNSYSAIRFTTRQLSCFTQLHELFYVNKVKIVPRGPGIGLDSRTLNIEELLTPVSLAYWAMDDGSKQNKGFHFNTHGYKLEQVELLSKALLNKFN
jgi:hypothetical protein